MEKEEKHIKISGKIIIFIVAICIIVILASIIYMLTRPKHNILEDKKQTVEGSMQDIEIVNYEGTFQAKGVIVRTESNNFTLMPIIANEEYRNEEKFYIENNQIKNLKQGQEVIVTFHYRESFSEKFTYEPIAEKVEILKEESDTQIPRDVLVKAYSTKENITIAIDKEKSNNKQIVFTITDKNELKYDYSTMKYNVYKYNAPPEKQEVIYTENGAHTSGYNPWPELTKIAEISNEANYTVDDSGNVNVTINYSQIYGELNEGEYCLTFSTVSNVRQSITNSKAEEYPYDGVIIDIKFSIKNSGKLEYGEVKVH